jgi:hypothetical protein
MKTGFINAYADKPIKKQYKYHGLNMECNKTPNPDPFEGFPTYEGPGWQVLWDADFIYNGIFYKDYTSANFIASLVHDDCPNHFTDYFKRYYFCEINYYKIYGAVPLLLSWSDGDICSYGMFQEYGSFLYKAGLYSAWAGGSHLFFAAYPSLGSHYTIWRSENGNLPGYYPVPPDSYYS